MARGWSPFGSKCALQSEPGGHGDPGNYRCEPGPATTQGLGPLASTAPLLRLYCASAYRSSSALALRTPRRRSSASGGVGGRVDDRAGAAGELLPYGPDDAQQRSRGHRVGADVSRWSDASAPERRRRSLSLHRDAAGVVVVHVLAEVAGLEPPHGHLAARPGGRRGLPPRFLDDPRTADGPLPPLLGPPLDATGSYSARARRYRFVFRGSRSSARGHKAPPRLRAATSGAQATSQARDTR